jgi:hypothetical protein
VRSLIVRVQVGAEPLQSLLQPVKIDPLLATAVSVTSVPGAMVRVQTAPQSIPAGVLDTVPPPVPAFATESSTAGGGVVKLATTVVARLIVTEQGAVPLQAPLQPAKVEPAAAAAVSVSFVPGATISSQSAPQAMPAGTLVTVPAPTFVTESVTGMRVKVAVTELAVLTVTVQDPVPLQRPLQPANVEPAVGVAVRVSWVPGVTVSAQSLPHAIPGCELVTVPVPEPVFVTESATGAGLNVAVTEVAALTVTVQAAVPVQAPLQPAKVEPAAGVAVRVS